MTMYRRALISAIRRALLLALLWGGLLLCGFMVKRHWVQSSALFAGLGLWGGITVVLACTLIWSLAVASWQRVIFAHGRMEVAWGAAARHLALLLVGKYLPGGIWGFAARLADSASLRPMTGMLAAGLTEQWFSILMIALIGGVALLSAEWHSFAVLMSAALFPLFAIQGVALMHRVARFAGRFVPSRFLGVCKKMSIDVDPGKLWCPALLTMIQMVITLAMVGYVAHSAYALNWWSALAVAGSYGLGVTIGMAVIFMPGGILVREMVFVVLCKGWIPQAEAIALAGCLRLIFTGFDFAAALAAGAMQVRRRR